MACAGIEDIDAPLVFKHEFDPGSDKEYAMHAGSTQESEEKTAVAAPRLQRRFPSDGIAYTIYALAIAASVFLWVLPIRAPLGIDETGTYWQISTGFSAIWPRQFMGLAFPAYPYILWFFTKCIGNSEMALRIPSLLAMLGAAGLLYRAAREFFETDIALIATLIFCLHPIVVFESVDVRPYAFAVLVTNAAILVLLRLRTSKSLWLSAIFGFLSAFVLYFHHLFATLLPAFLACFITFKIRDGRNVWKQLGVALAVFCVAVLPLIPGLEYLFRTANSHVYEAPPRAAQLVPTLAPGWVLPIFVAVLLLSIAKVRAPEERAASSSNALVCAALALIPVLILFGVSAGTSIHTFADRHRLSAVPGIALTWALGISSLRWRLARPLFCAVLTLITIGTAVRSPRTRIHFQSWKYALEVAEKNASVDQAPVVMCSPFIESDFAPMPAGDPTQSIVFAPLTYYKLTVPVVPLPKEFTAETVRVGSQFLSKAIQQKQRFLVVAYTGNPIVPNSSYPTAQWIEQNTSETYSSHWLGIFDQVAVVEFVPQSEAARTPQ